MRRQALIAMFLFGCSKGATPAPAPEAKAPEITAEMPDTKDAKSFAASLIDTTVSEWSPTGNSDFEFLTMSFAGDGTWAATAKLVAGVEDIECNEVGSWKIAEVTDATQATVELTVTKTACANRENGAEQRILMSILNDGSYKIAYR